MTNPSDASATGLYPPLTAMDFHVLLVLAEQDLHGYGIMKEVETQSAGRLRPEIGSLYRMIGRLMTQGLIEQAPSTKDSARGDGRGKPRRHYRITEAGREMARAEATRLREVLSVAAARDLLPHTDG